MLRISRSISVFAMAVLVIFTTFIVGAQPTFATVNIAYGGIYGNATRVYGIDGYIRPSTSIPLNDPEFRGDYINLCVTTCSSWVQLGTYQGTLAHINSAATTRIYYENNWNDCSLTTQVDAGSLATANQAYYMYFDGLTYSPGTACPSNTAYEFIYKKGSYTSSPIYYGYGSAPYGQATVATELHKSAGTMPENISYFGTDDSHVANASNGIHIRTSSIGNWGLWSPSQVAGLYTGNPPFTTVTAASWSFRTTPS